jgi:hypothetical protein
MPCKLPECHGLLVGPPRKLVLWDAIEYPTGGSHFVVELW